MKVSLCEAMGTCFGVEDAVNFALEPKFAHNLTIVGQLVHNPQTLKKLVEHGVRIVDSVQEIGDCENVMITAHGAPESLKVQLASENYQVFDASCPLVLRVHQRVGKLVKKGYHPVVIGQRDHVEVRGIVGDLDTCSIILKPVDLDQLAPYPRLGIVSQTTQPIDFVVSLVQLIQEKFPEKEIHFVDTVCKPTKDRQNAVRMLAPHTDLMIVVGGYNSSNTKKLKELCEKLGVTAHQVEGVEHLNPEWFLNKKHVGITAGTSTPHQVIEEVYQFIKGLC